MLLALVLSYGHYVASAATREQMKTFVDQRIVPDVLDKAPKGTLKVTYPSGVVVDYGNTLTPAQTDKKPKFRYSGKRPLYTLAMVDPDAPSRLLPLFRELLHFLVVNIPGNKVDEGDVLADYLSPAPPMLTGPHRYTFVLFEQENGTKVESDINIPKNSTRGRMNFSLRKFAAEKNLGEPVAANFFKASFDSSVPRLAGEQKP